MGAATRRGPAGPGADAGEKAARPAPAAPPDSPARTLLAVDVGNTTTQLGLFAEGPLGSEPALVGSLELTTPERLTADEVRLQLLQAVPLLTEAAGSGGSAAEGALRPRDAILACVVPSLSEVWRRALAGFCPGRTLVVGPGLKTGLRMRYDDPSEVGADRVADAVAARADYGAPVVVVDLGTTTNFEVVDADGAFAGGIIAPGLSLGARSLSAAAARLPVIELRAPAEVVGRNTRAAMQSGVVWGEVARIDGLLDAIARELGTEAPVVLTGDSAREMAALLRHEARVDDTLTLRGLCRLWWANRR